MTPAPLNYSPDPSLTPLQHRVLTLLAEGRSLTDAAAEAGVHRNTVYNWRRSIPSFACETEFAIREQAIFWHDRVVQDAPLSDGVLHKVLNDETAPASLRLRAAVTVLKAAAKPPLSILASEVRQMNPKTVVHKEIPKTRTIMHNATACMPPQPSRNFSIPHRFRPEIQELLRAQSQAAAAPVASSP